MAIRKKKKAGIKRVDKRKGVKRKHHNIPDELDEELLLAEFNKYYKYLNEDGKPKPITVNQLKQLIRSAVRKRWMSCPVKLAFFTSRIVPDRDPETRRNWKIQCDICLNWFLKTAVQVDHINGENEFTELSQLEEWVSSILDVGFDDLQILCTDVCHPIKTLSESHNVTFEEAVELKKAIAWENDKSIKHQDFLIENGFSEKETSNSKKRRICYLKFLESLKETAI